MSNDNTCHERNKKICIKKLLGFYLKLTTPHIFCKYLVYYIMFMWKISITVLSTILKDFVFSRLQFLMRSVRSSVKVAGQQQL